MPLSWGGFDANLNSYGTRCALMASRAGATRDGDASIDEQTASAGLSAALSPTIRIVLVRPDMESLLGAYLVGTQGVELGKRLDFADLPGDCVRYLQKVQIAGRIWVAWSTATGPMAAWGDYDRQRSERLQAHVLLVEWWVASSGHHRLWARSDPKRPTEWTFGRGND